jgi:hypothetical protein
LVTLGTMFIFGLLHIYSSPRCSNVENLGHGEVSQH